LLTGRSILMAFFDVRTSLGTGGFFLMSCLRWLGIWMPLGLLGCYVGSVAQRRVRHPETLRRM
jgi:hypothetical protein